MNLRLQQKIRPSLLLTSFITVVTTATLLMAPLGSLAATKAAAPLPGPFVTLLSSRTEMTAAINCAPNNSGIATIEGSVAPYLASLGMTATGTLVTNKVTQSAETCTHYNASMMASWADATSLSNQYGWSFVSHTADYPSNIAGQTAAQQQAETCGSAQTLDAHGLHGGHGLVAYPGSGSSPATAQAQFGSKCFAWGRQYHPTATTDISAATTAPYWQITGAVNGGACNTKGAACYNVTGSSARYTNVNNELANVAALKPGKWMTLQSYVLVTGTSPAGSSIKWDCTSSDPLLHWSNDNERYCYSDWQKVVQAIAARKDITVTDPLTVGIAFGRPATYQGQTGDTSAPTTPQSFNAAPDASDTNVALSWTASTDNVGVTGYELERSTDQSNWSILAGSISGTSYTDTTTAAGTQYYYRLKALDAAGNASGYATATATTWSGNVDTSSPSMPGSFQATADTADAGIALTWDASTDDTAVTGYTLERSTDQSNWSVLSTNNVTSYQDNSTDPSTHYYYRLSALDAAGNASDYATTDVVSSDAPPVDSTPPSTPGSFQANTVGTDHTVSLSWNVSTDNVGVTGYEVDRSTDQSNWSVLAASQTSTSYSDSTTAAGTTYYYRVKALDAAGNSSDYATANVTTPAGQPTTKQYVTNASLENGSATGWSTYNSSSTAAAFKVAGGSKDGSYALKVSNTAKKAGVAGLMDQGPHWVNSTVAGKTYTGSMWLSGPAGAVITVQIRECNASGSSCPGLTSVTAKLPASGWIQATVPYSAKANGNALRFTAYGTIPAGGNFLADLFSLTSPN